MDTTLETAVFQTGYTAAQLQVSEWCITLAQRKDDIVEAISKEAFNVPADFIRSAIVVKEPIGSRTELTIIHPVLPEFVATVELEGIYTAANGQQYLWGVASTSKQGSPQDVLSRFRRQQIIEDQAVLGMVDPDHFDNVCLFRRRVGDEVELLVATVRGDFGQHPNPTWDEALKILSEL